MHAVTRRKALKTGLLRAGALLFPVGPLAVLRPPATAAAPASVEANVLWAPRIAIVWPHDGDGKQTGVAQSRFVNISVWPANQVSCGSDPQAGPGGVHQFYL